LEAGWIDLARRRFQAIQPHPGSPFPCPPAFATFFATATKVRKATVDKLVRPPALATAFTQQQIPSNSMKPNLATVAPALAAGLALLLPTAASAAVTYDWVTVGNPGNAGDTQVMSDSTSGYGAVADTYRIGKYEVTNAQYTDFLNAVDPSGTNPNGIYNVNMGSNVRGGISFNSGAANGTKYSVKANMGNKPVNYVSWYDSARFANWMNNGQGTGDTETGTYTLTGNTGLPTRNTNSTIWLPSENEWYKAAYHDPVNAGADGNSTVDYWLYPTQSDSAPTLATATAIGDVGNSGTNVANYILGADWNGQNGNVTTVGSAGAGSASYYGTFDQGGNLWEWNEAIIYSSRGLRGGSWFHFDVHLQSSFRNLSGPAVEIGYFGFRLASVPEPSSVLMAWLAGVALLTRRRRPSL
jgi:formylglycine-generating enzyme